MSCCRINNQELASLVGIVMVELWVPRTVIVCTSFGSGRALARWLATRTPASAFELSLLPLSFRIPDAKAGRGDPDLSGYTGF
ncbi:hypothetical protein AVEN_264025-1 [Araneus ventricosus]|uniref:Uncharacterized protein n=1 Tax=Araneus ventricosus TaxID=182803 RepID=A0A4Y2V6C8_ARAVE|nr:hypothetical protein AVEN_264025-1 [Araneus ventricosus]